MSMCSPSPQRPFPQLTPASWSAYTPTFLGAIALGVALELLQARPAALADRLPESAEEKLREATTLLEKARQMLGTSQESIALGRHLDQLHGAMGAEAHIKILTQIREELKPIYQSLHRQWTSPLLNSVTALKPSIAGRGHFQRRRDQGVEQSLRRQLLNNPTRPIHHDPD